MAAFHCPSWCVTDHGVEDDAGKMVHWGRPRALRLTASGFADGDEITFRERAESDAMLQPAHLHVELNCADRGGFDLTPLDAQRLVALLQSFNLIDEGRQPAGQSPS